MHRIPTYNSIVSCTTPYAHPIGVFVSVCHLVVLNYHPVVSISTNLSKQYKSKYDSKMNDTTTDMRSPYTFEFLKEIFFVNSGDHRT